MAASGDSPDLSVVDPSRAAAEGAEAGPAPTAVPPKAPAPEPESVEPARRGRWITWLLAIALAVALLWGLSQGRYAAQLTAEVTRLEAELSAVGAELDAHRSHLETIRSGVDDVTGRMLALRDLARVDPMAASERESEAVRSSEAEGTEDAGSEAEAANPALPPSAADF